MKTTTGPLSAPEPVAPLPVQAQPDLHAQISKALALAMTICDAVPTRAHLCDDSTLAHLGKLVNAQGDGAHGYAVIRDAEAAWKAAAQVQPVAGDEPYGYWRDSEWYGFSPGEDPISSAEGAKMALTPVWTHAQEVIFRCVAVPDSDDTDWVPDTPADEALLRRFADLAATPPAPQEVEQARDAGAVMEMELALYRNAYGTQAPSEAAIDVLDERRRQVEGEGWTAERDDAHIHCELARAAASSARRPTASALRAAMAQTPIPTR